MVFAATVSSLIEFPRYVKYTYKRKEKRSNKYIYINIENIFNFIEIKIFLI